MFNKEEIIENTMDVNIYYQKHKERIEISMIGGQKQSVILEIPQLACYNPEIDQKIGEVKIMRCSKKCEKNWRLNRKSQGGRSRKRKRKKKKKERSKKRRSKRKKKKEKTEKGRNDRSKEGNREMEDERMPMKKI